MQDDLYREIILDHYRNPRHRGSVEDASGRLEATNPLCGDELTLTWRVADGRLEAIAFTGRGCSISQASASMMCDELQGLTASEALELGGRFRSMLTEDGSSEDIGDLEALQGVRAYPVRIKCALLAWSAMMQGLGGREAGREDG